MASGKSFWMTCNSQSSASNNDYDPHILGPIVSDNSANFLYDSALKGVLSTSVLIYYITSSVFVANTKPKRVYVTNRII